MSKKYSKYYKANIIIFIDDQNTVKTVKNDIYRDYPEMQKNVQKSDARESILRRFYFLDI